MELKPTKKWSLSDMCLLLRENYREPYSSTDSLRFKVISVVHSRYYAPYQLCQYNMIGENDIWNGKLRNGYNYKRDEFFYQNYGFHVFVHECDAVSQIKILSEKTCIKKIVYSVKKVRVCGFLASGTYHGKECETYERMTFID